MPIIRKRYPPNWEQIATAVKQAADWQCEKCGRLCIRPGELPADFIKRLHLNFKHVQDYLEAPTRHTLTTSHRDQDPRNNQPANLWALCPTCHLNYDRSHRERQRHLRREYQGQLTLPVDTAHQVKMISLWQPWASLIAWGAKRYETRGWATGYRGPVAIHAAKRKPTTDQLQLMYDTLQLDPVLAVQADTLTAQPLPLQQVVAIARVTDCVLITPELAQQQTRCELMCGDWRPGRYAWQLRHITPLYQPIPIAGHQGLRDRVLCGDDHLRYALQVAA